MTIRCLLPLSLAFLLPGSGALAAEPSPAPAAEKDLATITVTGSRLNDTEARQFSTATKIIFGREELDRYGDSTVGEVLKRLPGITISGTPGRGGDIRMRGLGRGYTMIMLNGEPAPRGFSLDSLSPEQVERIEIMRAPVAEHTARAIAGSVNIVLREDIQRRGNEIRPSLGWESNQAQEGISFQRSDTVETLNYNLTGNLFHKDLPSESTTTTRAVNTTTGATTLSQVQQDRSRAQTDGLNANARLNWRLGQGENLTLMPFLMNSRTAASGTSNLDQSVGAAPAPYATAAWRSLGDTTLGRLMANGRFRLDGGGRLELRARAGLSSSSSQTDKVERDANGAVAHTLLSKTGIRDTTLSTAGKYSRFIGQGHQLAAGLELEGGYRKETASNVQDGIESLARVGNDISAQTTRWAGFAQDEWEISPLWAVYGGLRAESIQTRSATAASTTSNTSRVLSPLLHSVWRFTPESKDQVRLAITRTYKSPTLANLVAVPTISSVYPVSGTNTPTNADTVGNPALRPELAWGLDLAFEHYFVDGGLVSASFFRRSIRDLIRNVTSLQTVSWSGFQRWVSAPVNVGDATSHGVELEAKFRLDEVVADAPKLNLRSNLSIFRSDVSGVPGPNNRLDQQPRQTLNLGADYRLAAAPWTVGATLNLTPGFTVQQTDSQSYIQGTKRIIDLFALWQADPLTRLRLSISNWTHADYSTGNREVFGTIEQTADNVRRTWPSVAARLEIKY